MNDAAGPPGDATPLWLVQLRILGRVVTGLGAGVSVASLALPLVAGRVEWSELWAIPGLAVLCVWSLVPFRFAWNLLAAQPASVVGIVGLTATSGYGLVSYGYMVWEPLSGAHVSSTSCLAYLFVPLWQLTGCGIVLLIAAVAQGRGEPPERGS